MTGPGDDPFLRFAEALPQIVWRARPDGHVDYISADLHALTGRAHLDLQADGWLEVLHPDDRARCMEVWRAAVAAGEPYSIEFRIHAHAEDEYRWHLVAAKPSRDADGRIVAWYGSAVDIHDRKLAEQALQQREARLTAILESEPECVKVVAADGRLLSMNAAGLRMIEAETLEAVVQRPILDLVHPDDRERYTRLHRFALGGGSGTLRFRIRGLLGGQRWMETHSTPLRDPGGRVESVLSVTRDVTERLRLEEELAQSLARIESIMAAVDVGIHGLDAAGRFMFCNAASTALLGYDAMDLLGQPAHGLVHHHRADGTPYPLTDCPVFGTLQDGRTRHVTDEVYFRKDGSAFPVEYTCTAMRESGSGAVVGAVVSFRDVSVERSNRELLLAQREALRRSEERFRSIYNLVPVSIWDEDWSEVRGMIDELRAAGVQDLGTYFREHPDFVRRAIRAVRVVDVNDATLKIIGARAREQIVGSMESVFASHETVTAFAAELEAFAHGAGVFEAEMPMTTVDGRPIHVLVSIAFPDPDAESGRVLVSLMDMTARRHAEHALQQAQKMESIGQLTGGVAHDFNNLLTVIVGNAEALTEALQADPALQELAAMTLAAAERGAELTSRLLAFSRRHPLNPQAVDVASIIHGLHGLLRRTLEERVGIELRCTAGLRPALVDRAQLENALLNLCINARDAMPDGGTLTIATGTATLEAVEVDGVREVEPGRYIRVSVHDTGAGMDEVTLARAFEPFFTTKGVGAGSGLGLSMVYGFVRQSGGHVRLASCEGGGTTVELFLPEA